MIHPKFKQAVECAIRKVMDGTRTWEIIRISKRAFYQVDGHGVWFGLRNKYGGVELKSMDLGKLDINWG